MRNHLKIMGRVRTIHYCNVCDYKTNRKYDKDKHVTRMHGSNIQKYLNQACSNILSMEMDRIHIIMEIIIKW